MEWLLIAAVAAGLAALAVVLVTNVVDQTAEQIGGSSARKTGAQVAAAQITQGARDDAPTSGDEWTAKSAEYKKKCDRLRITYGDVTPSLIVLWTGGTKPATGWLTAWQGAIDTDPPTVGCSVT